MQQEFDGEIQRSAPQRRRSNEVKVGRTRVGRGVFAGKRYRACDLVGEITGDVIDDPDYGSDYCFNLENGFQLEPFPPFRYVNHSCDPNCRFDFIDAPPAGTATVRRRIFLYAVREIKRGDELTIEYNWDINTAIPCRCQSPSCRGWIADATQLDAAEDDRPED